MCTTVSTQMDYDSVKEHLAVMLVNTQANKRMLQEMPHEISKTVGYLLCGFSGRV